MNTRIINFHKLSKLIKNELELFERIIINSDEYKNGILIDPHPEELNDFIKKIKFINHLMRLRAMNNDELPNYSQSLVIIDINKYNYYKNILTSLFLLSNALRISVLLINSNKLNINWKNQIKYYYKQKNNIIYNLMQRQITGSCLEFNNIQNIIN